jgi:hypothetical protein
MNKWLKAKAQRKFQTKKIEENAKGTISPYILLLRELP